MRMSSLTRRAVLTVLLAELLCAVAFSLSALWHERGTRLRTFDVMLQGRSDSLLGAIQDAEDPEANVTIDPAELSVPAHDVYAVYNQGGRILGMSSYAPDKLITRSDDGFRTVRSGRHSYRVLQRQALRVIDRAETSGVGLRRPVTILYASPMDFIWHEIFEAASFYVIVSVALLCATGVILILLVQRMLRPIGELATEAAAVTASSLIFRAPASALRLRELKPLAEALSATIVRLRHAFEKEQRFVGDAAHELKTAVAVVRSTVQVLSMRTRSTDEYRQGLDAILTDNERVEELVSRMLTLTRFEERQEIVAGEVSLSETVQHALRNLGSFAEAHGVSLSASLAPEVSVRLIPEAAQVLVSNLVVNAVQHSPRGAEVRVAVTRLNAPADRAILEVKDFGTGISAENLPHVFERFFREDRSRSRQTGGAGLGLAICKSIVEAASGVIEMESLPGRGTTVTVSFSLV
jgi:signal transduction histidine kinase